MCACACVSACVVRACVCACVRACVGWGGGSGGDWRRKGGGGEGVRKACGNVNMEGRAARNPLLKVKQSL